MEKSTAKQLILEYQQLSSGINLIPRTLHLSDGLNYVLVGLRRCGKSYMLFQKMSELIAEGHSPEEMLYFNFEDERLGGLTLGDLDLIKTCYEELYPHRPIFFLDEVQNVEGWEHFARRIADQGYTVYITGSNSKMLSREIAGVLGGRYLVQSVWPYSFGEYLSAEGVVLAENWQLSPERSKVVRLYSNYFRYGGLPEVQKIEPKMRRPWLENLYNKIFFGDILMRYAIRNTMGLKLLLRKLAESVKQPSSYSRLAGIVSSAGSKTRVETVMDYVSYAEESCIIFGIENYAAKIVEKSSTRKYYYADNGLLSLFLFDPETSLLENIVAIRLKSLYDDLTYYHNGTEVDFFLWEHGIAIQACWSISNPDTLKRETDGLLSISERLGVKNLVIVTNDESGALTLSNGLPVRVVPAYQWLLEEM